MSTRMEKVVVRTVRTFIAAFIGNLLVYPAPASKQALNSAVIAGITAVWNLSLAETTPLTTPTCPSPSLPPN